MDIGGDEHSVCLLCHLDQNSEESLKKKDTKKFKNKAKKWCIRQILKWRKEWGRNKTRIQILLISDNMNITYNRIQGKRHLSRTKRIFYIVKGTVLQEAMTDIIIYLPNDIVLKSISRTVKSARNNEFTQRHRRDHDINLRNIKDCTRTKWRIKSKGLYTHAHT